MANQTVTTTVNYDDASIGGLLNGETLTINGGSVTVDADVRWNQQAAVLGAVTLSSSLGGSFFINGTQVWEIPFSASTGNVPTQGTLGTNGVTGGTSGATGELTRVWATGSLEPAASGGAMPATGFIKLRSKTGTFQAGETITLTGGATITALNGGKRSWIHVVGRESSVITVPRLGNFAVTGDWYELGTTNGLDNQTIQFPIADECPAFQMETAPGSGVYEWWLNAARKWVGHVQLASQSISGMSEGVNVAPRPAYNDPAGFLNAARSLTEGATNAVHTTGIGIGANAHEPGVYTLRTYLKKATRRYGFAQIGSGTNRYGIIIDFDAAGAVVANPLVGTPVNATHTVLDIGGGWYRIDMTIDVPTTTSGIFGTIGTSNSATPTYSNGVPTFLGSASESIWYTELQLIAPASVQYIATDERGKVFFSNPQTGAIIIAERTARTAGFKPPSGCKIRIPNVILSNAPPIDYASNSVQVAFYNAGRYGITTTSAGIVSISHATMNWAPSLSSPFSVNIQNSALNSLAVTSVASTQTYNNIGVGMTRDAGGGTWSLTSCPAGGTLTDVWVISPSMQAAAFSISGCANFTLTRNRVSCFGFNQGRLTRFGQTANGFVVSNSSNIVFNDPTVIGASIKVSSSIGVKINNMVYADQMNGATPNETSFATEISTSCRDLVLDGFTTISSLSNVHPRTQIMYATTNCFNIVVRNVGTPTAPFNGGSANQMTNLVNFVGTIFNSSGRRLYAQNLSGSPVVNATTNENIEWVNCWGDAATSFGSVVGRNVISRGCRWSNPATVQNAVYGVHWEDAFTGTTSGRITIFGNEPLTTTIDQCSFTFGVNAGFTSAGNAAMPNLGDEIIWTMPYYALGHTGIAQFGYGNSATETWVLNGTNPQNFEFSYQIDTGSGFSAWKSFLNIARRFAGGTSGTNTITVTSSDWDAMTTKPQVGDYVVIATGTRLPANTTITNIAGYVLTLSNNFSTSVGTNEIIFFYKDIRNESINPTTGYKLKIKVRTNTANNTNLFSNLRIPFDTNATAQQTQYSLPGSALTVNGLVPNSRVKITRTDTGAFLTQAQTAGTSILFDIPYEGSVTIEARNASGATTYKPWQAQVVISNTSSSSITALQELD